MIRAKDLNWKKYNKKLPLDPLEYAEISVLHRDNYPKYDPARYTVNDSVGDNRGYYSAVFWAMNRGIELNDKCKTIEEAKTICQNHYDRLIIENAETE